jgi:glycosyltransferase involved in cell wall biosynthesis
VSWAWRRVRGLVERPQLTIEHRFRPAPYGGSNQFLTALRGELERRGLRVSDGSFGPRTRACLLHSYLVDVDELRAAIPAGCRVVHRVDGPIALYRGHDDGGDRKIVEINDALADGTVFQSQWSREAHRQAGIELREPVVIPNAVDPTIFFPPPEARSANGRRLRVIATSWSDNPRKGAGTVAALARAADPARYDFTFVGRTPHALEGVRVFGPLSSGELAAELRTHDIYVAASMFEPCSNALLEALASGLPVLYRRSGSHAELVGEAGIGFDDEDEAAAALDRLAAEVDERRAAIRLVPLADVADRYLAALGLEANS